MSGVQNLSSLFPVPLKAANNLSDLASVPAALTALGLGTTAAAELARIGGAAASDLNVAQQNILYQGLLIAALRGVPTGLVDGVIDPYSTTGDINTGASSGYTFTSSAGTIGATAGSLQTVSTQSNAIASSAQSSYPASAAFDGNTGTPWESNDATINGVSYIGQDFGAGNTKAITALNFTGYGNASYSVTSALLQYADSPGGPWTTAATLSLAVSGSTQSFTNNQGGARRCWRLLANSAPSNGTWVVYEVAMQAVTATSAMTLQSATLPSAGASPSAMRGLVQVDSTSAAFAPNTDLTLLLSRDGANTWTQGTLGLVQTMPDGTTIYDTGWSTVTGQPAGNSTMTYKLTTPTQKAIVLTGASMQVRP